MAVRRWFLVTAQSLIAVIAIAYCFSTDSPAYAKLGVDLKQEADMPGDRELVIATVKENVSLSAFDASTGSRQFRSARRMFRSRMKSR